MVDKDLFLHDLSVVAILKNEGHYLKEWLDYHLLAGVDHFYLYDNDSPDNQVEVAAPYVEAGLVTYIPFPGKGKQLPAYNDAIKHFKFQSRYMAFIDGDEFIFPKIKHSGGGRIIDVVDEILSKDSKNSGLVVHWQCFGSNGKNKADYSKGVLERFTRRAPIDWAPAGGRGNGVGNICIKSITNPRRVDCIRHPHYAIYFSGFRAVNEMNIAVSRAVSRNIVAERIVLNHYMIKSLEEYTMKLQRGAADGNRFEYASSKFDIYDHNEEFDDSILKYRDARAKVYQPPKPRSTDDLLKALERNLSPTFSPDTPPEFYAGKMETFLTCRAVSSYLQEKFADNSLNELLLNVVSKSLEQMNPADAQIFIRDLPKILNLPYPVFKNVQAKFFEEASLKAILKSLDKMSVADVQLLMCELPNILNLPYPVIKEFSVGIIQRTPQIMRYLLSNTAWDCLIKFHHLQELLCEKYNLKQMIAARIDIKLMTTTGDFQILSVSDDKATVWKPGWFQKNGIGYQIQSYWNASELEIVAKSTIDGQINLGLKGLDIHTPRDNSKRFPYWVDYTRLIVNGKAIFDIRTPTWHDKPYRYTFDVKGDDEIKIQVEWQPHRSDD